MSRSVRCIAVAAGLFTTFPSLSPALAQFPDKPIRFLVGFAAGGPTDLSARALAKVAPRYLEQQVVVVNMAGAAGALAMHELVNAAPDGYTIAMMTTSYKALVTHQQRPQFDSTELKTLLGYAEFRQLLFVKSDSPYARFDDMIALGRKNPGAIKFGHSGTATASLRAPAIRRAYACSGRRSLGGRRGIRRRRPGTGDDVHPNDRGDPVTS